MAIATVVDPVEALRVLDGLLDADLDARSDGELADDLRALQLLRNRLDGEFTRRLGVFDARGGAAGEHALSTQAWVRSQCLLAPSTAHGRVALARRVRTVGPLQEALRSGSLSYEHAVVITRALDALPVAAAGPAEAILVAAGRNIDPGQLRRVAGTIREAVAPDLLAQDAAAVRDRRFVNVSETLDGMVAVDGLLDAERGAVLLAAVRALATPTGPDDTRTPGQRRADALTEAVTLGLTTGRMPVTGGERPHLTGVIDLTRLADDGKVPTMTLSTGSVLAGDAVLRLLCDAQLTRVVTAGPSEILDVGRATRIVPAAIRRALHVRDGGCVGYDCDRPPQWTQAHHVIHWRHGGPTSLRNLALLCVRHHALVHDDGWVMIRNGPGWLAVPPYLATAHGETVAEGKPMPVLPVPALNRTVRQTPRDPYECFGPDRWPSSI